MQSHVMFIVMNERILTHAQLHMRVGLYQGHGCRVFLTCREGPRMERCVHEKFHIHHRGHSLYTIKIPTFLQNHFL